MTTGREPNKFMGKANKKFRIGWIISALALVAFSLFKITQGVHSDEVHQLAVGEMIAQGNAMFKECWFYLQMSSVFTAPIIWIYEGLLGSSEGIILFFRVLFVFVQTGISAFFFLTFRKKYEEKYVFIASLLLFMYCADFPSFQYKQLAIWFSVLEIIFLFRFVSQKKVIDLVLLGVMISCSVLSFPTTIVQFALFIMLLILNRRRKKEVGALRDCIILFATCLACALLFFAFVFSKISIAEFLVFFPKALQDENLQSNFISKLWHPLWKMAILAVLSVTPMIIISKVRKLRKWIGQFRIPIISFLLLTSFAIWIYSERAGVTWHVLTYPYTITVFIMFGLFFVNNREDEDRQLLFFFAWPMLTLVIAFSLASNQNNLTCMYPGIISTMGLLLMFGKTKNSEKTVWNENGVVIVISLLAMALFIFLVPVYEQETTVVNPDGMRSIFNKRVFCSIGPAKRLFLGETVSEEYDSICGVVDENVTQDDKLLVLDDNQVAAYGYLDSKGGYATYSPQGGWGLTSSETPVEYYQYNEDRMPTVVVARKDYIGDEEEFWKNSPIGVFLKTKGFEKTVDTEKYLVLRTNRF